ncbi:MAG: hypothetical protein P4M15_08170 [Alphaproteobacteria bacterium]|nr:hypothetical protein [Alphaproteobacteria bacterium]
MNTLRLSPVAVFRTVSTPASALLGDGLDLGLLDLESYWTSGETFAALGYDEEPQPVPAQPKSEE